MDHKEKIMVNKIGDIKEERFQFLHRLYELSGGDERKLSRIDLIAEKLGFDRDVTRDVVQDLKEGGRVKVLIGGGICITRGGIQEVEARLIKEKEEG
jgi:hypothetical protein